jgi:hypothetical protein
MRKLLIFILFVPLLSFSQNYKREDIVGEWKISKCELFINNILYKSSYINETNNKILEGKYIGNLDTKINEKMTTIVGTNIFFNEDSTVTWDASISELNISNAYWQVFDSGLIAFCEWKNRARLRPLLLECEIITILNNMFYLKAFESGLEIRMTLNR